MKKFIAATAVLAALSSAAMATDQDINLHATVASFCTVGGKLTPAALTQTIPVGPAGCYGTDHRHHWCCRLQQGIDCHAAVDKGRPVRPVTQCCCNFQNYISYGASVAAPAASSVTADTAHSATTTGTGGNNGATQRDCSVTITPAAQLLLARWLRQ